MFFCGNYHIKFRPKLEKVGDDLYKMQISPGQWLSGSASDWEQMIWAMRHLLPSEVIRVGLIKALRQLPDAQYRMATETLARDLDNRKAKEAAEAAAKPKEPKEEVSH